MNKLASTIAMAQFEKLDDLISKKRRINQRYKELLAAMPGITFQNNSKESESNFWLTTILVDDSEIAIFKK